MSTAQFAAAPQVRRPGWVTAAAVILLSIGGLSALFGLLFLLMGVAMGPAWGEMMRAQPGVGAAAAAMAGMIVTMMIAMAVVILAWAAGNLLAGIGILGRRGWARILGLVVAVIGALLSGLALLGMAGSWAATADMLADPRFQQELREFGAYGSPDMMIAGLVMTLIFILPFVVAYVVVLVVLIRHGAYFAR
jgi:hypothetical protein